MLSALSAAYAHSPALTLLGLGAALFLLHLVYAHIRLERKIKALGGGRGPSYRSSWIPWGIGFVRNNLKHASAYEDHEFWSTTMKENGNPNRPWTFEVNLVGQRTLFTADEDNIKAILATQFQDYGKGEDFRKDFHDFLGDSIFTTDGAQWHDSRQLIRPQFIKDRVSDLHVFEEHIQIMLPQMVGKNKQPVNVTELFFRFTLDAATDFLLGESVQSLVTPKNRFADAFAHVQHVQAIIARMGPLNKLLPRGKFRASLRVIDEFIQPFIEQSLRLTPDELNEKTKSAEGYTFLHALASFTRDRQVLRDQLMSVLLAARDTTAVTMSWLFYELSRHPEVWDKLRAEILAQVGRHRTPTYTDLKEMRYLQHTLNEILRIYPAVPFNVRVALKDTTLPRGAGPDGSQPIGLAAGSVVGYSTAVLQRRHDIYPPVSETFPDPSVFAPDRWQHWTPRSWTYVPFNGGPRICVGQQFALTEMGYTVTRILQKYKKIENKMYQEAQERCEIVMQPSVPVRVLLHEDDE
ncbi:cytochrome P450 [Myriangium duriaei CBS 260.36]|uniref:Cytochrome P450 n=1 Tax=Myriangium duriaei CBS 260.36 TaxID=1168546 RepID=A0A9P4J3R4_9PEZI|nr:cytochrome P450 [Myriangium duriaei CBS 260.36]